MALTQTNVTDTRIVYSDSRPCGFCGKPNDGYAKQDENGEWQPACWNCVKPENTLPPQKRQPVGTVFTEDLDAEEKLNPLGVKKSRAKGLSPSTSRAKPSEC